MPRHWLLIRALLLSVLLAVPAAAQEGIRWQQDLEGAKAQARQSGRLVLVHFWTPECGPCKMLEQNVFNQPGVAGAVETRFVPVKLNANENSATAEGFGITRVPTDIIITPDGQVVGKLISPPTPAGYVAEVTKVASQYTGRAGGAFDTAVVAAPAPSLLNSAYAGLQIPLTTPPAIPVAQQGPGGDRFATSVPFAAPNKTAPPTITAAGAVPSTPALSPAAQAPVSAPPAAAPTPPATTGTNIYASVNNGYSDRYATLSPAASAPPIAPPPQTVPNQYVGPPAISTPPVAPPAAAQPSINTPTLPPARGLAPTLPSAIDRPIMPPATPNPAIAPVAAPVPQQPALADPTNLQLPPPDPRRLPAGSPPLGFDGYCPVNMRNHWKWIPGQPQYGAIHRGRTYWFASPADQDAFLKNPDYYTPALSGYDPVLAIDHKQQVPGRREHSLDYDNLFYLFASEATLQQFTANPEKYAAGVRQAMGLNRGRLVR